MASIWPCHVRVSRLLPGRSRYTRCLVAAAGVATSMAIALSGATIVNAEGVCANEVLRVENRSEQLPDCRAYELVSPSGKTGGIGDVLAREYVGQYLQPMQGLADGDAITYDGEAFTASSRAGSIAEYVSMRGSSGWSTTNVSPPEQDVGGGEVSEIVGASADLTKFLIASVRGSQLSSEAPEGYRNIYLSNGLTAPTPLITATPTGRTSGEFGEAEGGEFGSSGPIFFAPAAENFSQVLFGANAGLTENAPAGSETEDDLYRWMAGKLRLVNVLPSGATEPEATLGVEYRQLGLSTRGLLIPNLDHAVSADGARAFWTDERSHTLYLREAYFEAGQEEEKTAMIGEDAQFLAANKEGTVVFFTKGGELYEYDVLTKTSVDVTPEASAEVQGMVGMSENGQYFYFVANGILASGASDGTCGGAGSNTACNLYLDHGGVITLITTLSGQDNNPIASYEGGTEASEKQIADWTPDVWARQAEASPNGQFLAFGSHLPLTGQMDEGPEIFVYDESTRTLACASCSRDGVSNGGAALPPFGDSYGLYEPRYMLNDGQLFFTTRDALVPEDTNNQKDVYEWANGEVHLISGGTSAGPSVFAEASEDGSDVFFTTSQALVPEDRDEIVDMYDAREDGGFPAPTVTNCASSDECQGSPPAPATFNAPPSATLSGSGNITLAAPTTASSVTKHGLTRAQKLASALRTCRKIHVRKRRVACEKEAKHRYGVVAKHANHRRVK
jgi:hypothetical protein